MDEYQIPVSGEQINTTQIRTEQTQQQRDITRAINFQEDPWIKPEDYANRDKRTDKEIARFIKETSKQLEEDELLDILNWMIEIGLPVTLEELGVTDTSREHLMPVAEAACAENDTLRNMPFEVNPEMVYHAILAADAFGRAALNQ